MSSYQRVKKYRALKRRRLVLSSSDDDSDSASTNNNVVSDVASDENSTVDDRIVNCVSEHLSPIRSDLIEVPNNPERSNDASASPAHSSGELVNGENLTPNSCSSAIEISNNSDPSIGLSASSVDSFEELELLSLQSQNTDNTMISSSAANTDEENDNFENILADADTLRTKLQKFASRNISTLNHKVLSELLLIFRSEGYADIPETAKTLLQTCKYKSDVRPMLSGSGYYGEFVYFGIENCPKRIISPETFTECEIKVLINVDGLPIYNHARKQLWPILGQLYNVKYDSRPFVVALYCGDSKPKSANDYLNQFVDEVRLMMENGVNIEEKLFTFSIAAFVCDTPARSLIKCTKGHGGFYACERCEVKGVTVNRKRVYGDIDSTERTCESFRNKNQIEHHIQGCTSPLLDIPGFDPVRSVLLDKMHLFSGVMKTLLEKLLHGDNQTRLSPRGKSLLSELLLSISSDIPMEFQRKRFDLIDIANWKANQFGFILTYCGGLILHHILPTEKYRHFLLLYVSCRILCHSQLAVTHADYAKHLLRQFFILMPTFYGEDSQVMNFHNLIHVADDVKHMNAPLTEFSAFPFENCLGLINKLIRTPRNPLAQVARRLHELQTGPQPVLAAERGPFTDYIRARDTSEIGRITGIQGLRTEFFQISLKGVSIRISHPDNVVQLLDGTIIRIQTIFAPCNNGFSIHNIFMEGYEVIKLGEAFDYPCSSSQVGIIRAGPLKNLRTYRADAISKKCMLLKINHRSFSITLLH